MSQKKGAKGWAGRVPKKSLPKFVTEQQCMALDIPWARQRRRGTWAEKQTLGVKLDHGVR